MNELGTESNTIEKTSSNIDQDTIFSNDIDKQKKNKSKKSIFV